MIRSATYRVAALVAALSIVLASSPSRAQPESMTDEERLAEAVRLSELGRLHYDGGDFEQAAADFSAAWELHPDPILGYNAARSYENSGEPERALEFYEATLALDFDDESLHQRCRDGITRLENLLERVEDDRENLPATLQIASDPPDALVFVDGEDHGAAPTEITLAPGTYSTRLQLEGYIDYEEVVELEPGQVLALRISLIAEATNDDPVEEGGPNWLAVGLVGGGGIGAIILGALAGAAAQNKYDAAQDPEVMRDPELWQTTVDDGRGLAWASNFFYAVGFAAIITAVVLYFVTDDSRDEDQAPASQVTGFDIFVGPEGAEAGFRLVW